MAKLPRTSLHALTLAGLLAATLTACGEQSIEEYIAKANTYLSQNEESAAIIELKNAIQEHPDADQARLMLGKLYLRQGDFAGAEKELYKALRGTQNKDEVEPLLAHAYLGQKKSAEIADLAEQPQSHQPEVLADLYAMKSLALLRDNDQESSQNAFLQAQRTGQTTLYTRLAKASLEASRDHTEKALKEVEAIVQAYPDSSEAWILKGHLETRLNQDQAAASSYRQAVQSSPKALQYTLFLAQALVKTRQLNEAEKYVDALLAAFSGHALTNELKATILYARGEQDEAKVHADLAIRNGSRNITTYLISGVVAYHQGNYALASERLEKIMPVMTDNMVKRLYAASQLKLGNIEGAMQTMRGFDATNLEDSQFISSMSLEFAKVGRQDFALSLAEQASAASSPDNQLRLGLLQLASHDATGIETLQEILNSNPDMPEATLGLAYYYMKQGKYEQLHEVADEWLTRDPDDNAANMLKAFVLLIENKPTEAKIIYRKILSQDPDNIQAKLGLAQIAALDGDTDKAFDFARQAYENKPGHALTTRSLYRYAQFSGNIQQAFDIVATQVKVRPDNPSLKLDLARGYILRQQPEKAIAYIRELPPHQQTIQSWQLLGDIYFSQKHYREAETAYSKWLEMDVLNQQAYLRNIQIKEMNNKVTEGLTLAEKAEEQFSQTPLFSLMKAGLQLRLGELDASQKTLGNMPESVKKQQYFMHLQALNYLQRQQYPEATAWQLKRYEAYPGIQSANDVAGAYAMNHESEKAAAFIESVLREHGEKAAPLRLTLAQLQTKHQPDKAMKLYRTLLETDPNNVLALNNLAWLYLSKKDYKQACDNASKAHELAKGHPQIQDTYGYCLLKSGQAANSLPMLEKAYRQVQNNPEVALHYAESLLANHQAGNARDVLSRVNTTDPELLQLKRKLEAQINL
ncbi:PEP-CTERM system TPR-repeat protein PrsT [Photobacterium sp. CCB-ST2H9]|uniref:XrtA/PEP-CTERM system TPR-repeat protein PrsT n=1 Tax=Photobacterium sp. CCB-ST2H9 TaxID=2912855 RepID=UPI002003D25F|nr:XrtA/PEP-CTERM system TPR-repeat protein PrsT [Photobacterium sp. CCB-ST2H9]UTM59936.1 PEP-CTERM system TPR-repeat protein PrsT [Photobacterium sp. CCB-ST2H9]